MLNEESKIEQANLKVDDQVFSQVIQETEKSFKETHTFQERFIEF